MTRSQDDGLRALFEPRSIAVVGASQTPEKYGYLVPRDLLSAGYAGELHLVNPRGGETFGRRFHESLAAIGRPVDLVVSVVPPARTAAVIEDCVRARARAVVLLAAGFAETGPEGAACEKAIVEPAVAGGVRVLGPNCLGLFNASNGVNLMTNSNIPTGAIALVSQSGGLAEMFMYEARRLGGGLSLCASIGNQADVRVQEAIAFAAAHEATRVVAVYLEGARDGGELLDTVAAVARVKPVVVLKGGRGAAGTRAAASHTASVAGRADLYDSLLTQAGAVVVERLSDFYPVALSLSWAPSLRGRRVALLGGGGGTATVMADAAERIGLVVPALPDGLQRRLRELLAPTSNVSNPVEFAGAAEDSFAVYETCLAALLEADEIDAVVLFGSFGGFRLELETEAHNYRGTARRFGELARLVGKPFMVQSYFAGDALPAFEVLREERIPAFASPETALRCLAALAEAAGLREVASSQPASAPAQAGSDRLLDFEDARGLFAAKGLDVVPSARARDWPEVLAAATAMGFPVVLKLLEPRLVHKTEAGAIATGLHGEPALRDATERLLALGGDLSRGREEVVLGVFPMVRDGIEAAVGAVRDPTFGPLVMVGSGGIHLEIHGDIAFAAAGLGPRDARRLIERTRLHRVLAGARGRPRLDVDALARVVVAVSDILSERADIAEIDLNPVFVQSDRAVLVDLRVLTEATAGDGQIA